MGYVRKRTFKISFRGAHEFAGLEVQMRTVGIRKLLELAPLIDKFDGLAELASATTPEQVAEIENAVREFARVWDSWNIEDQADDGRTVPVSCTADELLEQDLRLVNAVMRAWAEHLAGVPAPLEQPSPNGERSLEASLPMDVL